MILLNKFIFIKSTIDEVGGESAEIEINTEAQIYYKADVLYIKYNESEISGLEDTTTTLRVTGDEVKIIRFGQVKSNLRVKLNEDLESVYQTPYGNFELTASGMLLDNKISQEGSGELTIKYKLVIQDMSVNINTLVIKA